MIDSECEDASDNVFEGKPFKLPCLLKYEDLMAKYSGALEIRCPEIPTMNGRRSVASNRSAGIENTPVVISLSDDNSDNGAASSKSRKITDTNNEPSGTTQKTRFRNNNYNHPSSGLPNEAHEVLTVRGPSKSLTANNTASAEITHTKNLLLNPTSSITKFAKPTRRPDEGDAKPGTLGSRQAMKVPLRVNRKEQGRELSLNRHQANYIPAGLKINSAHETIDTKNIVDNTMIAFLPEICQRLKIAKLPNDPAELCLKFSLVIPDLGPELESVDPAEG